MTIRSGKMALAHVGATYNVPSLLLRPEIAQSVEVKHIDVQPLDAKLTEPFRIASDKTSRIDRVDNVLVSVTARDDVVGLGEAAPFQGISGDTQDAVLHQLGTVADSLVDSAFSVFELGTFMQSAISFPSARAALEMAFFDILAKRAGVPLYELLNPQAIPHVRKTDVTIPIVPHDRALELSAEYLQRGFERIKVKLDGDLLDDKLRAFAVHATYGEHGRTDTLRILIDANEAYMLGSIVPLFEGLQEFGVHPSIFEQPVPRDDMKGLEFSRRVSNKFHTEVFADESVYTLADAQNVIDAKAADGINLKLMKHGGIVEAMRIAQLALQSGLKLMIGGMVETRLGMTASLHVANAIGRLSWYDLDTPLLLHEDVLEGGIAYDGPRMKLPDAPGIGVSLKK